MHTSSCGACVWYSLVWLGAKMGLSGLSTSASTRLPSTQIIIIIIIIIIDIITTIITIVMMMR